MRAAAVLVLLASLGCSKPAAPAKQTRAPGASEMGVTVDREGHFVVDGGAVDRHTLDGRVRTAAKTGRGEVSKMTLVATCDGEGPFAALEDLILLGAASGIVHYRILVGDAEATFELPHGEGGGRTMDSKDPGASLCRDADEVILNLCGCGDAESHQKRWFEGVIPKGIQTPVTAATRAWVNEGATAAVDPSEAGRVDAVMDSMMKEWDAIQARPKHQNEPLAGLRVDGNVPVKHFHAVLVGLERKGIAPNLLMPYGPPGQVGMEIPVEVGALGSYRIGGVECQEDGLGALLTSTLDPTREGWTNRAQLTISADPSTCAGAVIRVMKIAAQSGCCWTKLKEGDRLVMSSWWAAHSIVKGKDGRPVPPRKTTLSLCATGDAEDHAAHWAEHSSRLDKAPVAEEAYVWWGPPPGDLWKGSTEVFAQIARQLVIEEYDGKGATVDPGWTPTRIPKDDEVEEKHYPPPTIPLIVLMRVDPNVPYRDLFALLDALSNSALHPQWADGG